MKGGGIVIVFFLFTSLAWGVASIVSGIRKAVHTRAHKANSANAVRRPQSITAVTAVADLHQTIASLRQVQQLRESNSIDEAEFEHLKTMLLTPFKAAPDINNKA